MKEARADLARLRPRVRPRRVLERSSSGERPPYEPLADFLGITLVLEGEGETTVVDELGELEAPLSELLEIARANLAEGSPHTAVKALEAGVWSLDDEAGYALERMLLPETFEALALDGEPVVFVLDVHRLLIVGSNDTHAQERALVLAGARMDEPGGLLDFAFVRRGAKWEPFLPPGAVGETLRLRILMHLGAAYVEQGERVGGQALAEFRVHMSTYLSATIWRAGSKAWLPFTSVLELDDGAGGPVLANWEDVVAAVPGALEPVPDVWPERFVPKLFPPPDVVERFRRDLEGTSPRRLGRTLVVLAVALAILYLLLRRS